jgi:transposase
MMRPSAQLSEIYLCLHPVDFRKGINGLAILVEEQLELSPFSEHLFVFTNKIRDKVRILY